VTDSLSVDNIIQKIKPDEIYNLSAQSHVQISFELPYYTGQVDGLGVLNIIESARKHIPNARILQSSTSELFGGMEYNRPINGYTEEESFKEINEMIKTNIVKNDKPKNKQGGIGLRPTNPCIVKNM
jgi:GDP-D-mannose dehydratase